MGPAGYTECNSNQYFLEPTHVAFGNEIHYALFYIQDAIMRTHSSAKLEEFPEVYNGAWFRTSEYFPGKVEPPEDPSNTVRIKVSASHAINWGTPIYFHEGSSRRPTGTYVAPGTIVKVKVPPELVNKGYSIRVDAPFFSAKNSHQTSLDEWRKVERKHPGAWAYEYWNESYAQEALDQIEMIQKLYFPDGRPSRALFR